MRALLERPWIAATMAAVAAGLLLAAGQLLREDMLPPASAPASAGAGVVAVPDAAEARRQLLDDIFRPRDAAQIPAFVTGLENLPASLRGTEVDGELALDASGHLRVTAGVRRVFDWFLAALGEEPFDVVIARLNAYLDHRLPPAAAAEARQLLGGYLAYREALAQLAPATPAGDRIDVDALRSALDEGRALRTRFLPADAAGAFYADDDALNRHALDSREILEDESLTPAQRATRLAALEDTLPPSLQASMKAVNQYNHLQALTADWQDRGGSPSELRRIRENLLGAAATDRLEALDRERAEWDARMQGWLAERAAVLANRGLGEPDRAAQILRLRSTRFSREEIVRVEALERIHDSTPL